jgi:hypothetical protein
MECPFKHLPQRRLGAPGSGLASNYQAAYVRDRDALFLADREEFPAHEQHVLTLATRLREIAPLFSPEKSKFTVERGKFRVYLAVG